ncbi:hypothetical protein N474_04505 [Pseudoalteromonas luteoviolacea CPMOR-2]|uniref:Lipoprotein n=1 Tax=Pseudoalteromonas luteoviolacea DSM 6061 TaxID=1365250 RepID=A0A166WHX1_9GAMM|nr:hypothetical protein [Pseudoalteromonas luteoviolacea]KZN37503.1 hypothetical protein N475_01420 [Pseudoalteromonas luteoviolacea DSM 6061]KZN49529.1 hypothetical protein N474_04505 [Pseudoalteromonas luteoviolacea CPMOR-2]MBE0387084.1 hypothetical protein [Pseudoalteromonas luteoviolacea DSM 6061]
MKLVLASMCAVFILTGCKVNEGAPYDSEAEPQDRTEYVGVEGAVQAQKDKVYLMDKELSDKCKNAKVDHAVALTNNDQQELKRQEQIIKSTCK